MNIDEYTVGISNGKRWLEIPTKRFGTFLLRPFKLVVIRKTHDVSFWDTIIGAEEPDTSLWLQSFFSMELCYGETSGKSCWHEDIYGNRLLSCSIRIRFPFSKNGLVVRLKLGNQPAE